MKKIVTTIMLASFTILTFAQLTPVPDFKNQPMALVNGKLEKLEKQTVENKTKAKGMGYGGVSSFILLLGESSPVVLSSNPTFLIKVEADVDPESVIYLRKVSKANKKGREVEMMRLSAFAGYGAKGKSVKKNDSGLDFTKVSDGVFSFTPIKPLEPGEYAFLNPAATQQALVFAFSVH
jgi:hypothetical protein